MVDALAPVNTGAAAAKPAELPYSSSKVAKYLRPVLTDTRVLIRRKDEQIDRMVSKCVINAARTLFESQLKKCLKLKSYFQKLEKNFCCCCYYYSSIRCPYCPISRVVLSYSSKALEQTTLSTLILWLNLFQLRTSLTYFFVQIVLKTFFRVILCYCYNERECSPSLQRLLL